MVRRIAALLKPHAPALAAATLLAALLSACRAGIVLVVRALLDVLARPSGGHWWLAGAVVLLFVVQGGARFGRTWLTRRAALQAESALRARLLEHLLCRDPADLQADGVEDALLRLGHDAGKVRTAVGAAVTLVQRPLTTLAVAAAAVVMAPRLAVLAFAGVPAVVFVIAWTGRRTRNASADHARSLARLLAGAADALRGVRAVQAYGAQGAVREAFAEDDEQQVDAALRTTAWRVAGPPLVELSAAIGVAIVIGVGAAQVSAGQITSGDLVAFLVALGLLGEPLKGVAAGATLWEEARGGLERVFRTLDSAPATPDAEHAVPLLAERVTLDLAGVTVQRGARTVLRGVDLVVGPGDIVVIQGPSGAGKSTLLDVVAGFVRPHAGRVSWNGEPAEAWTVASRRGHLALVDQAPWLGAGTLEDAVRLGRPTAKRAEVAAAVEQVGLDLPLDRRVGDRGLPISGGERRRVALARALLRGAPVLLLDEPTEGLDAPAERRFLDALRQVAVGRAVILVSHRTAPTEIATAIYELEDGALVSRGRRQSA